jgi:zinc transporter
MTDAPEIHSRVHDIEPEDGLLFACILDGKGGGRLCDWAEVEATDSETMPLWLHLDNVSERATTWLHEKSGIPAPVVGALLAKVSRPRSLRVDDGLLVILRGINLNEGAEPEDMVALRMWVEPKRIVTVRYERMMTPRDILSDIIDGGHGAETTPDLFVALSERLSLKINDVIIQLEDRLDALEAQVDTEQPTRLRSKIAESRQDTVANLQYDAPEWLDPSQRMSLRETADRTLRYLEDLDAARDRAIVVLDELANKMAESMNRTMYALSIVAAIFLPLSFLTGLLGINVGGMPGVNSNVAFWITCAIMTILMVTEVYVLRRLKWI